MADEITQADRELLAREYERDGDHVGADRIREYGYATTSDRHALRAIAAARRQGQAASGGEVTPIAWRTVYPDGSHSAWSDGKGHWPETAGFAGGAHGWEYAFAPPSAPVGVEARKRSAAELQKFIDLADDYDLDDCAIGALEAGIAALSQQSAPSPAAERRPNAREVARIGDMDPYGALRIGFDSDNDVYLYVTSGIKGVEFCVPGSGGGKSPRTRDALIALMVAVEEDNAADPRRDWWAWRNGAAQQEGAP